jgi:hypothetical protein
MGSGIFKTLLKIAPVAAAPFTGGASLFGLPASSVLGGLSAAGSLLGGKDKQQAPSTTYIYNGQQSPVAPAQAETFTPKQPQAMARPGTLNDLASFSPDQERASIATKGLNQGLGQDEDAYYRNLIQRSFVGSDGAVRGSVNSLLPIEQQYFGKRGIAMNDINSFLKGIST